jgi:hypothetical protein
MAPALVVGRADVIPLVLQKVVAMVDKGLERSRKEVEETKVRALTRTPGVGCQTQHSMQTTHPHLPAGRSNGAGAQAPAAD